MIFGNGVHGVAARRHAPARHNSACFSFAANKQPAPAIPHRTQPLSSVSYIASLTQIAAHGGHHGEEGRCRGGQARRACPPPAAAAGDAGGEAEGRAVEVSRGCAPLPRRGRGSGPGEGAWNVSSAAAATARRTQNSQHSGRLVWQMYRFGLASTNSSDLLARFVLHSSTLSLVSRQS